jgi:hypothetical protein
MWRRVLMPQDTNFSEEFAASIFRVKWMELGSGPTHFTLKMEAARFSEMFVPYHITRRRHNHERKFRTNKLGSDATGNEL